MWLLKYNHVVSTHEFNDSSSVCFIVVGVSRREPDADQNMRRPSVEGKVGLFVNLLDVLPVCARQDVSQSVIPDPQITHWRNGLEKKLETNFQGRNPGRSRRQQRLRHNIAREK